MDTFPYDLGVTGPGFVVLPLVKYSSCFVICNLIFLGILGFLVLIIVLLFFS